MKIMLAMIFCSYVYQECQAPYIMPGSHSSWHDCMIAGYEEAKRKTEEVGKKRVNRDGIYIKFICTPDNRPET